jgi:hypothetical protein
VTKIRPALTFENALSTVAGHIGWARVAAITGKAETTVRNWSDPDTTASITLEAALQLDTEFHLAGGEGEPFLLCYATRLDADRLAATPELQALIDGAAKSAKESGEAVAAVLKAAKSAASLGDLAIAERELEEAITAHTNSLAALRARRKALLDPEGTQQTSRAPEVAPPPAVTA